MNNNCGYKQTSIMNFYIKKVDKYSAPLTSSLDIIYNYFSNDNKVTVNNLKYMANKIETNNIYTLHDLNNINGNYYHGVLPTALKLCHYSKWNKLAKLTNLPIVYIDCDFFIISLLNSLIIVFRGTNSVYEWKKNLSINRIKYSLFSHKLKTDFDKWKEEYLNKTNIEKHINGKIGKNFYIHRGFYYLYKKRDYISKIEEQINIFLKNNGKLPYIITIGRSLGGGIATIASLEIMQIFTNIKLSMLTFAAPGVSNKNLALLFLYLHKRGNLDYYIRTYNSNDTVTNIRTKYGLWRIIGKIRHINDIVSNKNKSILNNNSDKIDHNFITIDCKSKISKMLNINTSNLYKKRYYHSAFIFSNSKNAVIFNV